MLLKHSFKSLKAKSIPLISQRPCEKREKRKAKKQTCSWNPHHGDPYGCHYFPGCRVKGRMGRWLARQVRLHFGGEKQHHLP